MTDTLDPATRTWTLRSYLAVVAALNDPAFADGDAEPVRAAVRDAARAMFPAGRLRLWRDALATSARSLADALPFDTPVDLMATLAEPWALRLAANATGIAAEDAARCSALAREIFLDAATATRAGRANDAALKLATSLSKLTTTNAIDVQSFVAISQTLPHLLVASWHALFTHDVAIGTWRRIDDKSNAIDELLRYAGPSHAVFRTARVDTECGGRAITAGDAVALMLADANRDPAVFADPDRLDLTRANAAKHVALGAGRHPCVGTPIIRLALEVATDALLARTGDTAIVEEVRRLDGFAIRAPSALVVRLSRPA